MFITITLSYSCEIKNELEELSLMVELYGDRRDQDPTLLNTGKGLEDDDVYSYRLISYFLIRNLLSLFDLFNFLFKLFEMLLRQYSNKTI